MSKRKDGQPQGKYTLEFKLEAVMPGFEASTWYDICAPKSTPRVALD